MIEESKKRLENIQAIEPYLNAMRNSSLGSWKMAINRIQSIHTYRSDLSRVLRTVSTQVHKIAKPEPMNNDRPLWVVVGSQKGLVSNFNRRLSVLLQDELDSLRQAKPEVLPQVIIITNRASFFRSQFTDASFQPKYIPFDYDLTFESAAALLANIPELIGNEEHTFYIYNQYAKSQLSTPIRRKATVVEEGSEIDHPVDDEEFPPFVIDSKPEEIKAEIEKVFTLLGFQEVLTNSIASENSFRHRILEEAKNNTDRLINELTIEIAMARKKEITKEIQELAVAAGLIT